ncbi:class I SAM-dependent methyltransferase [Reyranella sp. CPCC 100927]|uniref:class I SAM-dependent methyltransferase n=1 Tax=Reyranella sp. CPCC 100927 TaxID=2599616 RepID=UPI0011B54A75|nr:class I SAM-dependent methyltransferase [Reyranella sp. CPCC 100927]TWT12898.1 class I SAM-dependent methyltransferase [Reyranella sp. CPCC 100927]
MEYFSYAGYEIPIHLINMTGGGPETFGPVAEHHMSDLRTTVGVEPSYSMVEIGCGIGKDAITLTQILSDEGRYVGIDIIKPSIDWCQANIAKRHPNFSFLHFDVRDQLHNPNGTTSTLDIRVPVPAGSVDRIFLWSVFTHMLRPEIIHYMREFARILKPEGLVFATCFVYNDEVLATARKTDRTPWRLFFEHEHEPGCRINDPASPLSAVAFTQDALQSMVKASGLVFDRPVGQGVWSGLPGKHSQDVMVLRRRRRTWLGRLMGLK